MLLRSTSDEPHHDLKAPVALEYQTGRPAADGDADDVLHRR